MSNMLLLLLQVFLWVYLFIVLILVVYSIGFGLFMAMNEPSHVHRRAALTLALTAIIFPVLLVGRLRRMYLRFLDKDLYAG